MYDASKDEFYIINNIDYELTQEEKSKIDTFILSIDTINYPYLTETIDQLNEISYRLFNVLNKYDKKRLKDHG